MMDRHHHTLSPLPDLRGGAGVGSVSMHLSGISSSLNYPTPAPPREAGRGGEF